MTCMPPGGASQSDIGEGESRDKASEHLLPVSVTCPNCNGSGTITAQMNWQCRGSSITPSCVKNKEEARTYPKQTLQDICKQSEARGACMKALLGCSNMGFLKKKSCKIFPVAGPSMTALWDSLGMSWMFRTKLLAKILQTSLDTCNKLLRLQLR